MKGLTTFALLALGCTSVHAGVMPVIDSANLAQAITQVKAWKSQYAQMMQQYKQLQDQHAAMTGSRGLGDILNDPALKGVVPADVANILEAIQGQGGAALTARALSIRNGSKVYDCEDRRGVDKTSCQAFLNTNAQTQAYQQDAMTLLNARSAQIQSLQGRINTTGDPKAIAELQARLLAEASQVNNDANRLAIMRAMSDSADRAAQQAIKERELRNLSLTSDGSDTFVYKPYSPK